LRKAQDVSDSAFRNLSLGRDLAVAEALLLAALDGLVALDTLALPRRCRQIARSSLAASD
jgi:hypothetical protein